MIKLPKFLYNAENTGLERISHAEYESSFPGCDDNSKKAAAFKKAWEIRNFEIEMYWKRATYFWAFIASTFAAYFALISSEKYSQIDQYHHVEVYLVVCSGLILSVAWWLTNKGSKTWQRHWEVHVDLLEDDFTGPLYKTINHKFTYSVSKINEIVSIAFVGVWLVLAAKYLVEHDLLNLNGNYRNLNVFVLVASLGTICLVLAMFFGRGRGKFSKREIKMYRRTFEYGDP